MGGSIKKEMPKIVADIAENYDEISDLVGYQEISGDLIFEFKLVEKFLRKARFV